MACDANSLAREARCFCLTVDEHYQVQTYLLATLAGVSPSPALLMAAAKCFMCVSPAALQSLKTYLLCQVVSGAASCSVSAPTNFEAIGGFGDIELTWDYGTDPDLDFLLTIGTTPGGTDFGSQTFDKSSRSETLEGFSGGTYYLNLYARDSASCVSASAGDTQVDVS